MTAVFRTLSLLILFAFGLAACSDGNSESASAPAESTAAPAAMPEDSSEKSMGSSMEMEKAEGVIYQDEIYANWPYN
ncbi:MAG: hypothetical protein O7D86_06645 [Proteobacteria bacterium]|nr:hypothetical protein [Pseudomonadota bacterium]